MITLKTSDKELSDIFIRTGRLQSIVLQYILCGFIIFGLPFTIFWAGEDYSDAYYITLLFMTSLYIPAIQSTGIIILQAKNQLKFRTLLFLGISIISIIMQSILSIKYGAIGCAIGISLTLILGQGLVINIYYKIKQKLDILSFWKEIAKMWLPVIPYLLIVYTLNISFKYESIIQVLIGAFCFSVIYIPLSFKFILNNQEQALITSPLRAIISKIFKT